jgi:hypothetical protein
VIEPSYEGSEFKIEGQDRQTSSLNCPDNPFNRPKKGERFVFELKQKGQSISRNFSKEVQILFNDPTKTKMPELLINYMLLYTNEVTEGKKISGV